MLNHVASPVKCINCTVIVPPQYMVPSLTTVAKKLTLFNFKKKNTNLKVCLYYRPSNARIFAKKKAPVFFIKKSPSDELGALMKAFLSNSAGH